MTVGSGKDKMQKKQHRIPRINKSETFLETGKIRRRLGAKIRRLMTIKDKYKDKEKRKKLRNRQKRQRQTHE